MVPPETSEGFRVGERGTVLSWFTKGVLWCSPSVERGGLNRRPYGYMGWYTGRVHEPFLYLLKSFVFPPFGRQYPGSVPGVFLVRVT